jgi:hypothetical protein
MQIEANDRSAAVYLLNPLMMRSDPEVGCQEQLLMLRSASVW